MSTLGRIVGSDRCKELRPMPLAATEWKNVIEQLRLTRQQARIVELILRGGRDKQIAHVLGLRVPTVRTHLREIFRNLAIADRLELVMRVVEITRQATALPKSPIMIKSAVITS